MADIYLAARHGAVPEIPPLVHRDAEVRAWIAEVVWPQAEFWVEATETGVIALLVLDAQEVDQLYVDPSHTNAGVGTRLLDHAKAQRPGGLALWTFETNLGARRFYRRHGFAEVERTDGSGNEEGAPDIRLRWPAEA